MQDVWMEIISGYNNPRLLYYSSYYKNGDRGKFTLPFGNLLQFFSVIMLRISSTVPITAYDNTGYLFF